MICLKQRGAEIEPSGPPYSIFDILPKQPYLLVCWVFLSEEDNVGVQDKGEFLLQCSFIIDDG